MSLLLWFGPVDFSEEANQQKQSNEMIYSAMKGVCEGWFSQKNVKVVQKF